MTYTSNERTNLEIIRNVYEHVLKPLSPDRVDEFFRTDYIQHSPLAETGAAGLKAFLEWAGKESPLAEHRVKRLFADGDYVIAQVHVIIHPGDRGNNVIDIFRIENGLVAEHWDASQQIPETIIHDNGVF